MASIPSRLTGGDQAGIRADVERDIAAAVAFARESPFPPPEAAYADVYAETEDGA